MELLHEVEAVRGQNADVQDPSPVTGGHSGHSVHQSGEILHSKVVSVVSPLVAQSLQYFSED